MRPLLLILCLTLLAARARADAAPQVCEPSELSAALAARAPAWVQAELQLETAASGLVTLRLRGAERVIDLEGAQGTEAARLLALVAADMASPPETTPPPKPATANQPPPRAPDRDAPISDPPPWARLGLDLSVLRGGYDRDPWGVEIALRGNLTFWRHLITGVQLGFWACPPAEIGYTNEPVRWRAFTARAWLGARFSIVELAILAGVARYWLLPVTYGEWMPTVGGFAGVSWSPGESKHFDLQMRAQFEYGYRKTFPEGFPVQIPPTYLFGLAWGVAWSWWA